MDPDATLKEIREIHAEGEPESMERLLELIVSLDNWLSRGGRPPSSWLGAFEEALGYSWLIKGLR